MKKIADILMIAVMACSIFGCSQKKTAQINLQEESNELPEAVSIDEKENISDHECA